MHNSASRSLCFSPLSRNLTFMLMAATFQTLAVAKVRPVIAPIPLEVRSSHFTVTVNGRRSPVMHAAAGYYLLNFDVDGSAKITVTASDPHYWDAGVEVQPMRFGIRPERKGTSICFPLSGPAKLSITRPGDHFADSEMLFLFANAPDNSGITAATPGVRYYGPGVHREDIDAHNGDRIYLADGAVVFGALNVWQVHDVHVFGRGAIIYDGPQDPNNDEGWMHKPNWHVIVMDNASNIEIEGIVGIARSRTWMVQIDNPNLSPEFLEAQKRLYRGFFYKRFIEGLWVIAEGAIYKDSWSEELVYDQQDEPIRLRGPGGHQQRVIAVDYGTTNPMIFLDIYDDGRLFWVTREYYWDSAVETRQKTDAEYADDLAQFIGPCNNAKVIIDPSATSSKAEMLKRGIWHVDADNEVNEGIRITSMVLNQRMVRFCRQNTPKTIQEMQTYAWDAKAAQRGEESP